MVSPNYLLQDNSNSLGFILHDFNDKHLKTSKDEISYYKTKGPYAKLQGIAGSKQLQMFNILFTNNFKDNFNVTLEMKRNNSTGYYLKQQSFTNNFYINSHFHTKNNRYGFKNFISVNNYRFQENGGIINDTLGDVNTLVNKILVPVKLSNASKDVRELGFNWNNWFHLNEYDNENPHHYLNIESSFFINKYKYKDDGIESDNFYLLTYLDTATTLDSTRLYQLTNTLNYSFYNSNKTFGLYAGIRHELSMLWQKSDSTLENYIANAGFYLQKELQGDSISNLLLNLSADGEYIVEGTNEGNYLIKSSNTLVKNKNKKELFSVNVSFIAESRSPNYIFSRWYSNHYIWENKFNNTQTNTLNGELKYKFLSVSGMYKIMDNYLYFDELAYPKQHNEQINASNVTAKLEHIFLKHIGIGGTQTFQQTSSNLISLPKSISTAKLYYYGNHFKNNLNIAFGAELNYYDEFTPYGYLPATQVFYVQQNYKAGNFVFLDAFINARIRPVNFFLKMENVLHGMLGSNYSMVPGYYQPERAFRFGISWQFFD